MTVKLTPEYIESLVDAEEFLIQPEIIICKLTVGESVFVGEAYCFDIAVQNVPRGKESARRHAISKIFDAEAYHLKRERDKLNRKHGIHILPVYEIVRKQGGCIRLTNVAAVENSPHKDVYSFTIVDPYGGVCNENLIVDRLLEGGVDVQLQKGLRTMCLKGQPENIEESKPVGMGRHYAESLDANAHVISLDFGSKQEVPEVSPSDYKGDGEFSGSGASGSWGEREAPVQTTIHESPTSNNHSHSHTSSVDSSPSENSSSTDSGGSCSFD